MQTTTGISLLLDLYDCQSPALKNAAVLEEFFVNALQFGGFEPVDHLSQHVPDQGTTHIYILKQSYATIHTMPESDFISVDVCSWGAPETVRPALEIIRGYLSQKLIARTVKVQLIERGT